MWQGRNIYLIFLQQKVDICNRIIFNLSPFKFQTETAGTEPGVSKRREDIEKKYAKKSYNFKRKIGFFFGGGGRGEGTPQACMERHKTLSFPQAILK